MKSRPFEGVNILDFTWAGVGPSSGSNLGFYGATIVKVESRTRPDILRTLGPFKDGIFSVDRSYHFLYVQMSKRYTVTLNMNHPRGMDLAKKLVAWADIVVESFSTGVIEKMGLDYENLKKIKPDIIMLRTCMHGHTGPLAQQHGQGYILTGLSGMDAVTGFPGDPVGGLYGPFTDHIAPLFNSMTLIAALDYRRRTGKGVYIDQSQHESILHWVAPLILNWTVNHKEPQADGNRLPYAAPHGVYRCQGDDRWCAIAVLNDDMWGNFCQVIGNPGLADKPEFKTLLDRKKNEDALDKIVEEWTLKHTSDEVMELMQKSGIAAGKVSNAKDQAEDPQLNHYKFFNRLEHPEAGSLSFYHGPLFRLSKQPFEIARPPMVGEFNEHVYTRLLGLSDEEFVQLIADEVI
ncbi:MAG: CoA transferase [Dehalococcoidales bacterium]|nr:CoA transferase [Dehalococcoidales bacterium]